MKWDPIFPAVTMRLLHVPRSKTQTGRKFQFNQFSWRVSYKARVIFFLFPVSEKDKKWILETRISIFHVILKTKSALLKWSSLFYFFFKRKDQAIVFSKFFFLIFYKMVVSLHEFSMFNIKINSLQKSWLEAVLHFSYYTFFVEILFS